MKKLIILIATFLLVSVNIITPLSYAQEAPSNSGTIATLLPGEEFNARIKSIAKGSEIPINSATSTYDNKIKSIKKSENKIEGLTDKNLISKDGSEEVRAWYDNTNDQGILYYYSDTNEIYLNENSEYMFKRLNVLSDISGLSSLNTNNVTNMESMFVGCSELTNTSALSNWNTSNVESMYSMFAGCENLSNISGLSNWNTSNVSNMASTFHNCRKLSNISALSNWNTNNVTNMSDMFYYCDLTDLSALSNWNTNNVTEMDGMFAWSTNLTNISALSGWNTSNVTDMSQMFYSDRSLTDLSALSNWNTNNVTDMQEMFAWSTNLTNISALSGWNTSNVEDISGMFRFCSGLVNVSGINNWDTSSVNDMDFLFEGCNNLTEIDLSNRDTSEVRSMYQMFNNCSNLTTIYASDKFKTDNVTSTNQGIRNGWEELFNGDTKLVGGNGTTYDANHTDAEYARIDGINGLSGYFTAKTQQNIAILLPGQEFKAKIKSITPSDRHERSIKSIKQADEKKEGITDENLISKTGSEKVRAWYDNTNDQGILYYYSETDEIYMNENSEGMFQGFDGLVEIPGLSEWNTSNVINMNRMFAGCTNLTDISALSGWNTSNVAGMHSLFDQCRDLTDISALSNWNTSNVTDMSWMFVQSNINDISALSGWNTSNVISMSNMFQSCDSLTDISPLNNRNTSNVTNMQYMFLGCRNLSKIDLSNWNTSNVTDMFGMFEWCDSLEDISTLSGWNVSNVTDMSQMFDGCNSLTGVDLSNWNTSNVTSIQEMFYGCNNLKKVNLSGWNTSNVTSLFRMFDGCSSLTDISTLSNWNVSNVTDISDMFNGCINLTDISALSNWNTNNVTHMGSMFEGCSSLADISALSNWNVGKVTDMNRIFGGCSSLTDISALSNWNVGKVTDMSRMFLQSKIAGISALSGWNTSNVTNMGRMFEGCSSLTDISALSNWNVGKVTDMNNMFEGCSSIVEVDLSNWDTSNVTNMGRMFDGCNNLEKIYVSSKFTTKNVIYGSDMFEGCTKLVGGKGTTYDANHTDAEYARIDGVNGLSGYFTAITNETTNGCIGMDQANVTASATQGVITLEWNAISGDIVQISLFDPNDEVYKNLGSVSMASGEFNYTMQWDGVHNFVLNNGCSDFHYQFDVSMSELYPDEFINAYNWAYSKGIISESIYESRLFDLLTNEEIVDIMNKFTESLGITGDNNKSCTFSDYRTRGTSSQQAIINKFCQLGLISSESDNISFEPNDYTLRTIFGTALSRALWGDQYEGGEPYYSGHLNALKAAGIMNDIDEAEFTREIKGYVLLMLMRATPVNDEIDCKDPMIQLLCIADPDECPAACRTNKCDVNSDGQIGIGDQVRYTNNCVGYTTIVPGKEKCDVNGDGQIGIGDQVALGNCMSGTGSNSGNNGGNSNSQNSTTKKEEPKSQGYSGGGGGGRSSTTKASGGNSTTKTDNNKKTSTENARTTTTSTNVKGNTITSTDKRPIDYMVPTINKVEYNEGNSSEVLENGFTRERNNAYGFAYANGITTAKTIEKANLSGPMTRAAMAKMLSNYAINVLGKEPDTSKTPHFGDISKEVDKQYDNGITLAYQLGIMGIGTKNFRPYDPVTRGEFVAVLSRMLYNTPDGTGKSKYYEPHIAKLYNEGIISKTDPSKTEKRGNVMTMLMRSAK